MKTQNLSNYTARNMHGLRPSHGGNIEEDLDEEIRETTMAAIQLCSLKHVELDPATAEALEDLKIRFLASARATLLKQNNPPDIPPVLKLHGIVGRCSKPFEKQLTASDVRDDQSRLSMNKADVEACLLPLLNGHDLECGIAVKLYDRDGDEYSVTFKRWVGKIHVLTGTGWKQFYKKYVLKQHQHFVTVWMFYHASTGELCFAVTWRELPMDGPCRKKSKLCN